MGSAEINLEKHNFQWLQDFFYGQQKKRKLFEKLKSEVGVRQITALIGLRRTGKTTLLKQIIDELIRTGTERTNILFFSFDEEQPKIEELLKNYEIKTGKNIFSSNNTIYIFLDEIQKLENWQAQIKYFYDNYSSLKFFVSGSSSLFIQKDVRESLAGRCYEYYLGLLDFEEFLYFNDKEDYLKNQKLYEESIKKEFSMFLTRQFIEIISTNDEKVSQYAQSVLEKVVFYDIPKVFPIEYRDLPLKLLQIIANRPGMTSDYQDLSAELNISRTTLSNYFSYLEEAFLIKKIYNFSRNRLSSEKKMKKHYISTTSFYSYLNPQIEEPKLIENLVLCLCNAAFFWRTPQKQEVDFILGKNNKILPIEVKYRENILEKDLKHIVSFCKKFKCQSALLITKNNQQERVFKGIFILNSCTKMLWKESNTNQ
ncbi:MAG: hypothetical protein CVU81_01740 [Euryarchaeota archaeon HGW-Euryarchaeota-1]|nr:MAG: hypothetical protein CVU81_01740 [Euryarchaeota archaeon HGW-Euryarchaeota-1]